MNYFSKFICGGALLLGLGACSNDEPGQDPGNISDGESKYLSVQIISTSSDGSRATTNSFEDGKGAENRVDKIRFYFFTSAGEAALVCKQGNGTYRNFYDWVPEQGSTPTQTPSTERPNVEKVVQAVVVIDTQKGDKLPAQILAVVNPQTVDGYNEALSRLRYESRDYATEANKNSNFVMTNSVYADEDERSVISATKLAITDFKSSADDAKNNPVAIYVERNVAKVRATFANGLLDANNMIPAKVRPATPNGTAENLTVFQSGTVGETQLQQVYLKINGWNVISYMPAANLSKHIDLDWGDDLGFTWNAFGNKRSYWAMANKIGGALHVNIPYTAITLPVKDGQVYVNENADKEDDSGIDDTKIIVSATLCTADGTPLTVCEFTGIKFVDNNDFTGLKNNILRFCNNTGHTHWKKVSDTKWEEMTIDDITFIQNVSADTKKYEVYATLTDDAAKYTWKLKYTGAGSDPNGDGWEDSSADDINAHLADHKAKIYNKGASYFYSPIIHYEDATTTLPGIVRNHIYEINVDGFYGLGTPVYDPDWTIETEKITDDDAYLAAQVKILSWRLVKNSVIFDDKN